MKAPRVEDFDPNAAPKLGSPMDDFPSIEMPPAPVTPPSRPPSPPSPSAPANEVPQSKPEPESKKERMKESKNVRFLTFIHTYLDAKADNVASFRYPQSVVDLLDDMVSEVWQQHKKKITKTSVLVAAISYLVWDYREHGETSTLYRVLIKGER